MTEEQKIQKFFYQLIVLIKQNFLVILVIRGDMYALRRGGLFFLI